ncbi:MAG: RNA polymerase-binding protein DksA [Congregibacter sp.]
MPSKVATPAGKAVKTAKSSPARKTSRSKATRSKPATEFRNAEPYKAKRGEEYMNEKQREHFKAMLRRWKSELMEEVDRTVSHMKDEAANFPDPADRATQEEEFSLELRTRDRERKLIKKIDSTIERIEQDDYGFCDACGVEIGIKRLEARPTASLCIDCKTLDEIKERQEMG